MAQTDPQFEALLSYLKEERGFDFTGYKRSSLMRRVSRRMAQLSFDDHAEYLDYLQVHPEEFTPLFNMILINVTGFFRDPEAWDRLRETVLPKLLAAKAPDGPVRVWSAGCASGEEAYTLAILLAEALGPEEFRRRVKIYATDVDDEGLAQSRHATYSRQEVNGVPPALLERYFETAGNRHVFRKDLRRSIIFGRNDLIQDAPISRIDLLVCRNTLMYFNAETQSRILSRFHFALCDSGTLFLGKAEMLLSHGDLFAPTDLKRRIFRKVSRSAPVNGPDLSDVLAPSAQRHDMTCLERLRTEAYLAGPVAQVVVTTNGLVALANREAEVLFGVSARDIGRPFRDLDLSYRPVELRGYIEQARTERKSTQIPDIEYARKPGTVTHLEIQVNPLADDDSGLLGVALAFHDTTAARHLRDELEYANRQLGAAYEDLQSTNEELETTNEELQSTVEELETTNEELQSTNDELQSINEELRERTEDLDNANAFLEAILTSLQAGVTVLSPDLMVRVWNRRAEDLWGLRQDEVTGQHFFNLDIGLPAERLRSPIRQVLADEPAPAPVELQAIDRRGRSVAVRVSCSPLRRASQHPTGVILVMEQRGDPAREPTGR